MDLSEISEESLVGEWKLETFEVEESSGEWAAWGKSLRGLLTYTPAGYVFVGINRNAGKPEFSPKEDSLFYSGTLRLEGGEVFHDISVATGTDKIGRELKRAVVLDGNQLELSGNGEKGEKFRVLWTRAD